MSDVMNCLWIGWSADTRADKPVSGCIWWWAIWQGGCIKVLWEHMAGVEVEQQHFIEWWVRGLAKQLQHNVLQAGSRCGSGAPSQYRVRSGCGKILCEHWHCMVWGGGSLARWLQQNILGVTWHTSRWFHSTRSAQPLYYERMNRMLSNGERRSTFQYDLLQFQAVMHQPYCSESKEPVLL